MLDIQLGRRNLPPAQRISVVDKFKKKIQEQAKEKQSEAGKEFGNGKSSSSPNGEKLNIHTDKELAKMAGVGTGTIARYNRVMKSDDEAKQRKVAVEYVKLCGYKNGGDRKSDSHNGNVKLTLDEIASQLGTSKTNLKRALTIERNLTESMKQLLDDGVISKTVQQRKSGNVSRNWKDCMGLEMVQQMKKAITELVSRIIRLTKNLNLI